MRILVTGHTGFKGTWLSLMLLELGHQVSGLALDPEPDSIFSLTNLSSLLEHDIRQNICDRQKVNDAMHLIQPEFLIHMAAQPLVKLGYQEPLQTFDSNVLGTLNILNSASQVENLLGALFVTTDKVYHNFEDGKPLTEKDPLGFSDPYSTTKAMSDLLIQSWIYSNLISLPVATARAGNVIGGGDVSADRLIPDLVRSFKSGKPAIIRNPKSVRPWQHVLDCLNGYLLLMEAVVQKKTQGVFNFAPSTNLTDTVEEVANLAAAEWQNAIWQIDETKHQKEANLLRLDATKARELLNWNDLLPLSASIMWTMEWEKQVHAGKSALDTTRNQIRKFLDLREAR